MTYYTIKEVSEKSNISTYTLRYYEREGLLPCIHRQENGHRLYDESDLKWLQIIACMRATNMPISDIKNYMHMCLLGEDTLLERYEIILHQKQLLQNRINEYNGYLNVINKKVNRYEEMKKASLNCNKDIQNT